MTQPRYVVATDLSPASRKGASVAASLAAATGATLDFYCAVPGDRLEDADEVLPRVRVELQNLAAEFSARGAHTDVTAELVEEVSRGILEHARKVDAALVAVSPQGATGWDRVVFGSVTERLLQDPPPALLVTRAGRTEPPGRVLLAADHSRGAHRCVREALAFAGEMGAEVVALHVIEPPGALRALREALDLKSSWTMDRSREKKAHGEFDEYMAQFPHDGGSVTTRVVQGDPPKAILEQATECGAEMIVMGAHGRSRAERIFVGSVARAVCAASQVPVLLIRDRPPERSRTDTDTGTD